MAIATGNLRHKVALQVNTPTQDVTTGEMVPSWATIASLWAEIVPMSGREFLSAGAEQSEVRGRMTIRYREGVTAGMRIVYRGMYYDIKAVMPDADSGKEHLTLMVAEGVRVDL